MTNSQQLRKVAFALHAMADEIDRATNATTAVTKVRQPAKPATTGRATNTTSEQVLTALRKLGRPVTASELAGAIPGARGQAVRWLAQSAGARVRERDGVRLYSAPTGRTQREASRRTR